MNVAVFLIGALLALIGQGLVLWREQVARRAGRAEGGADRLGPAWTIGPALVVIALVIAVGFEVA